MLLAAGPTYFQKDLIYETGEEHFNEQLATEKIQVCEETAATSA